KISSKSNEFDIKDVLDNLKEKMVRRHPHVFKEGQINTPDQV
ncbi:MAG TPA: nucleoside triphosphate pyrophosphohydrolase, partial [Nitrospina sp.]|nr:nucleoside triphosphate pyrophosphohydrolase [Nitrospina sp.]